MPRRSVLPFRSPLGTLRSDLSLPRPHYFVPLFSTLLRSLLSFLPYSIIPTPNSQISTIPRTTNLKIPLTQQPVPPAISHPRPNLNLKALPQLRNKIYFRQRRQTSAPPMIEKDSSESVILCSQGVWFPPTETAGTRYTFVKKWYPY